MLIDETSKLEVTACEDENTRVEFIELTNEL
jgi:hypothetical protein